MGLRSGGRGGLHFLLRKTHIFKGREKHHLFLPKDSEVKDSLETRNLSARGKFPVHPRGN